MHTCEVKIESIPEGADYCYTHGWWYVNDISNELQDYPEEYDSLPTCGAPATKKVGLVWVCDPHYIRNAWLEDPDEFDPKPAMIAAIVEGGRDDEVET